MIITTTTAVFANAGGYYTGKFADKGYDGAFCDNMRTNLGTLIPTKSLPRASFAAIRAEHETVAEGSFGASHTRFVAGMYGLDTTPALEYQYAMDPSTIPASDDRAERGPVIWWRKFVDEDDAGPDVAREKLEALRDAMNAELRACGIDYKLEKEDMHNFSEVKGYELLSVRIWVRFLNAFHSKPQET